VRAERAGVGGEGYRFYLFLLEIMGKLISKIHLHTSVPWRDCERERERYFRSNQDKRGTSARVTVDRPNLRR
jgi:hypothetical protein